MADYTPGPWHYATKGPGLLGIYAGDARFARPSDLIAGIASADNQEATARLIAAAPDLLAVLGHVYDYYAPMTIFDDETGDSGHDEMMQLVRNAIVNARGG